VDVIIGGRSGSGHGDDKMRSVSRRRCRQQSLHLTKQALHYRRSHSDILIQSKIEWKTAPTIGDGDLKLINPGGECDHAGGVPAGVLDTVYGQFGDDETQVAHCARVKKNALFEVQPANEFCTAAGAERRAYFADQIFQISTELNILLTVRLTIAFIRVAALFNSCWASSDVAPRACSGNKLKAISKLFAALWSASLINASYS
jgi:hypothetical protein